VKYFITTLFVFVLSFGITSRSNAQTDAQTIIDKVAAFYSGESSYKVKTTYRMFRGFTGSVVTESYNGQLIKHEGFATFKLLNTEMIQSKGIQLLVDHEGKKITYSKTSELTLQNNPVNISQYLDLFDKNHVTERGNQLICELVSSKQSDQIPYGKVVLFIDKTDYKINKQVLYFSSMIPFAGETGTQRIMDVGRLEISFIHERIESGDVAQLSDFLNLSKDDKPSVSNKYSTYQLINQAN